MEWKTEMRIHKAIFLKAVSGVRNRAGIACMAVACVFAGSLPLSVQAAPATLTSSDAIVYEQADEESSPVGNLIEGSVFEYIGDVTAADGSVWYQIMTAGGVNGYIQGDREMEAGAEESVPEEQGGQEASPEESESVSAENEPANGSEGAGGALEADGGEDEELSEEDETSEDNNTVTAVRNMQNNQTKKYVLNPSAKIKERESHAGPGTGIINVKSTKAGTDETLLTGMAVVFFCAVTVHVCLKRIRMHRYGTEGGGMPDAGRGRGHRKIEKKERRKAKKAVQGRKEGVKIPKEKK